MLMLARQKISSGFFLFEAEQKAKNEKKKKDKKRIFKKLRTRDLLLVLANGDTTVTDKQVV